MRGKRLISIVAASLLLLSGALRGVWAVVEPSPFQPEINQLGALENVLNETYNFIAKVIDMAPTLEGPSPNVIATVNMLEVIDKQLMSADDIIFSVVDEVMGVEPTPFREDLIPALAAISDVAQAIDTEISAFLNPPTGVVDPTLPEAFVSALTDVLTSALNIATNVQGYIDDLSTDCTSYGTKDLCDKFSSCVWIFSDNIGDSGACTYIVN